MHCCEASVILNPGTSGDDNCLPQWKYNKNVCFKNT